MSEDWKDNPGLSGIDKGKLDLLQSFAQQGQGKSPAEMLPFLMSAAAQGKNSGLQFSQEETALILEALKAGRSPEETARLDRIVHLMKLIR